FEKALTTYYKIAGWDLETGNPTEGTLKKLSLGWLLEK
ncbi:aldehyde ferredoxin oxidoreductase C-terminal domain-containing protein, partial [Tepidimicrobium xylanilyticum]